MNISNWLNEAIVLLEKESGTARLDAEVMISKILTVDRSWLHAHPDANLDNRKLKQLNEQLQRRIAHEPLAYILKYTEFYGRSFYLTSGVLIPRPESEKMIDLVKKIPLSNNDNNLIVDVGTGSGALIISALLETSIKNAIAIDIDAKCLKITKINMIKHGLDFKIIKNNLLQHLLNKDLSKVNLIILANLPYVPEKYLLNAEAKNEPAHAIFGGRDGLDLYRLLFKQLGLINFKSASVLTEALPMQHQVLQNIALNYGFKLKTTEDFIQLFAT